MKVFSISPEGLVSKFSMVMQLDKVVPFGRSLDEYCQMFNLTSIDLEMKILGVADGPASFNAELSAQGGDVVSCDPLYEFSGADIRARFDQVLDGIIAQVKASLNDWVWSYHGSPEGLRANRLRTIEKFSKDYESRRNTSAYICAELPDLPFQEKEFDLALCSHFLFLYSDHLSFEFHYNSLREMLRVAKEVRVYPLLTLMLETSPYLEKVSEKLIKEGYSVEIKDVSYELQKGAKQMLVIKS